MGGHRTKKGVFADAMLMIENVDSNRPLDDKRVGSHNDKHFSSDYEFDSDNVDTTLDAEKYSSSVLQKPNDTKLLILIMQTLLKFLN